MCDADREIDRLTRERDEALDSLKILRAAHHRMLKNHDRLRAAIEGAPHAEDCYWVRGRESVMSAEKHCNCWKRRVLEGATTEEKSE